ncbi:MAG: sensor histidine kinase [Lachnospiraceae bacterium]|nr:sensor histidine kinase [Lachnospiraceae bacterium]
MIDELYINIIFNISVLVMIATVLTKIPLVEKVISAQEDASLGDQLILGVIFGAFCIFSTCTGIQVSGAIQNTRVMGALAGGLLGGPAVGIPAAIIGATHRYLYEAGSMTSIACTFSTLFEGLLGSVVWIFCRKRSLALKSFAVFFITAIAEVFQMLFILAISRPFDQAIMIVRILAVPMIVFNSLGMVLFFSVFKDVNTRQSLMASDKIRLALHIAEQCLPYIRHRKLEAENYRDVEAIIRQLSDCEEVIFVPIGEALPFEGRGYDFPEGFAKEIDAQTATCYVTKKAKHPAGGIFARLAAFSFKRVAIGGRLTVGTEGWAYLTLVFSPKITSLQAEQNFVEGLVKFFSTNYELYQVEMQKKLREQAEFKALQSQINPHFLFNCLNTITYFCREKPDHARELLLALSVYFRHTLNAGSDYMISVQKELEQVDAYLMLEKARFEERLQIRKDFPDDIDISVPTLILQPIVENAVKHGAMKREIGEVGIRGYMDGEELTIEVTDNGTGIPSTVMKAFYNKEIIGHYGLLNVDARLRSIYGENYGLVIESGEHGTKITMHIPARSLLEKEEL